MTGSRPAGLLCPARVRANGGAAFDAGVPGFENCGGMFVGPVERYGAAALQHDDERLAGGGEGFKQFLLWRGQVEAGAVAAAEAGNLDGHLFAFELRREADKSHDDARLFGAGDGFIDLRLCGRFPFERDAAAGTGRRSANTRV